MVEIFSSEQKYGTHKDPSTTIHQPMAKGMYYFLTIFIEHRKTFNMKGISDVMNYRNLSFENLYLLTELLFNQRKFKVFYITFYTMEYIFIVMVGCRRTQLLENRIKMHKISF